MPQHVGDQVASSGEATWDGYFGTVQKDGVRNSQLWSDQAQGEHRVQDDQVGANSVSHLPNAADQARAGNEHPGRYPFYPDALGRLLLIEGGGVRVGPGGQDGEGIGVEAAPQLPEVGLDASDLWGEVIGNQ